MPGTGVQSQADPAAPDLWHFLSVQELGVGNSSCRLRYVWFPASVFLAWLFPEADPETTIQVHSSLWGCDGWTPEAAVGEMGRGSAGSTRKPGASVSIWS